MTYFKANRESVTAEYLLKKRPTAFLLLYLIAKRAKRTNDHPDKSLAVGEALIGDYKAYGATEQIYRCDKTCLKRTGIATFRSTSKGTVAKLLNNEIFDINDQVNQRPDRRTNQRATNEQLTTNKKEKNEKNNIYSPLSKQGHMLDGQKTLTPLTTSQIKQLALELRVSHLDVQATERQVLDPENIKKYKTKDVYRTTRRWLQRNISLKHQETLDEEGMMVLKTLFGGKSANH